MKLFVVWVVLAATAGGTAAAATDQETRWQRHAEDVRIVRDNWGIAHIYGKIRCGLRIRRDLRPSGG